jgi:integrase
VRRHLYGAVSRLFDWAVARELTDDNPALRVAKRQRPKPPAPRRRCPSLDTVRAAWAAAERLPFTTWRDLARFLLLVPCRTGEVAAMTGDQVDLEAAIWRQPGLLTKNGEPHLFHLPPPALPLVAGRVHGKAPVFAGERLGRPFNSFKALLVALHGASGTSGWSWHDLRRAFVSHLAEHDHSEAVLDAILNHRQSASRGGVLGVYQTASRAGDQRRAMEEWAELVTGKGATVTPLPGAGR